MAAIKKSYAIIVKDMEEAAKLANEFAPEHLQIMAKEEASIFKMIRNAGAVFLGKYSPVAVGDYLAGTNHVLPTGGAARIRGGLSGRPRTA